MDTTSAYPLDGDEMPTTVHSPYATRYMMGRRLLGIFLPISPIEHRTRFSSLIVEAPVPSVSNAGVRSAMPSSPSLPLPERFTDAMEQLARRAAARAAAPATPRSFEARFSAVRFSSLLHSRDSSCTPSSPIQKISLIDLYSHSIQYTRHPSDRSGMQEHFVERDAGENWTV